MARLGRDITANLLAGMIGRAVNSIGPIVLVPLMIHVWGMKIYGEWLILTAIPVYVMLAPDFGLAGAVVNRMAYLTAGGQTQEAVYLYRSSWAVLICAALGFVGVGWGIAWLVDWRLFGVVNLPHAKAAALVGWSCVQIFVLQQGFLVSGIYRSAAANPRWGLMSSVGSALTMSSGAVALSLGAAPEFYLATQLVAQFLWFFVLVRDSRRIMPEFTLAAKGISLTRVKPYILPGLGHAGMPLVNTLQNQGVLLVVGSTLGASAVGAFQTMRIVMNGLKSLMGQFSSAIAVELPALLGRQSTSLVRRILVRNSQAGFLITAAGITFISIAGERVFRLWVGSKAAYDPALMLLLVVSLIPYVTGASFSVLLLASNQIHLAIAPLVVTAGVSITLVGVFARVYGLAGVGLALFGWESGLAVIVAFIVSRRMQFSIFDYLTQCFDVRSLLQDVRLGAQKAFGHLVRYSQPAKSR